MHNSTVSEKNSMVKFNPPIFPSLCCMLCKISKRIYQCYPLSTCGRRDKWNWNKNGNTIQTPINHWREIHVVFPYSQKQQKDYKIHNPVTAAHLCRFCTNTYIFVTINTSAYQDFCWLHSIVCKSFQNFSAKNMCLNSGNTYALEIILCFKYRLQVRFCCTVIH